MDYLNISPPKVTRDQALELVAHHLQMAQAYFEATGKDAAEKRAELIRLLCVPHGTVTRWKDDGGLGFMETVPIYDGSSEQESPAELIAALAWLDKIEAFYAKLEEDD